MFRSERLDATRPVLREAIDAASQALDTTGAPPDKALPPLQAAAQPTARWSLVHGFAMLMLDGRLEEIVSSLPGGEVADDLLEAVFDVTRVGPQYR